MAHFAKLNDENIVEQVIVVSNEVLIDEDGNENESLGEAFCQDLFGGRWIQTSYNANFRRLFAGVGMLYNEDKDEFEIIPDIDSNTPIVNESETL